MVYPDRVQGCFSKEQHMKKGLAMAAIVCPHCGVKNLESASFCEECGQAVSVASSGPHVVGSKDMASTRVGQKVQIKQLKKQTRKAMITLFIVGILNIVVGLVLYGMLNEDRPDAAAQVLATCGIVGVIFVGLGVWARVSPLPASIIGLVLYVSLLGIGMVLDPHQIYQGLLIKAIIILALVNGIRAGIKHRELRQKMG